MKKKFILGVGIVLGILSALVFVAYLIIFSAPDPKSTSEQAFTISQKSDFSKVKSDLRSQGFIKYPEVFEFLMRYRKKPLEFMPGGYYLSKNMNIWQVITKLSELPPDLVWVTIPEGWRKEQIGELMADKLGWSKTELVDWNEKVTRMKFDYLEGVYFPDTYLIPTSEKNFEVANRMIGRFNEKFAPYMEGFSKNDILWTTGLKIASLIQRETNNPDDMPLVSGIIWNRLLTGVKLDIDATLQYAKGKVGDRWWGQVVPEDKYIDSPYNTYANKGLPPAPICNPGLDAIAAALNPVETDCIFYLHDKNGVMYCSKTYEEHKENIVKYLRD
jgi:UPF0755 protein